MSTFSKLDEMQEGISRRTFLAGAAAAATVTALDGAYAQSASVDNIPIIDTHIHLFDGTRPLGARYMVLRPIGQFPKPCFPLCIAPWRHLPALSAPS